MADREKMSVADMLAAARKADGDGDSAPNEEPAEAKADAPQAAEKPAEKAAKPPAGKPGAMSVTEMMAAARASDSGKASATPKEAAEKPAAGKPAGQMSVAEMMAAARAEKSGGAAAKEKPAGKAKAKPAATKATPAPAAKSSGPKDTASILAAARSGDKSGPVSKAEAAARGKGDAKPQAAKGAPPMPAKPAYARPPAPRAAAADEESRRGFFGVFLGSYLAFGFTALGLTNLLWTLGFARFMFPNILTEPPTKFKVGPPGNFAPGAVETKYKAQFGVWIVNALFNGAQILFALKSVCTHLGCTPNWLEAEQKFKCPCHGSGFYKDGVNFEGPAPRPLERYAVKVAADGQLEVDKSATFQEEKGQWTDTASYVNV